MRRVTLVILSVCMILGLCACAQKNVPTLRAEEIRAICDLATLECYYNNVAKYNKPADNIFQKDRKMWIEYEGKATIGIDMSDVVINISGETVSITLPKAKILSTDYTFKENSYVTSADGWLVKNEISTEEQQSAVIAAQEKMKQSIQSNVGLFLKAEARAKELIENYIIKLGEVTGRTYAITWNS